jgi:drug/metabolite transporter (DMT)-like permease
VLPDGHAFAIFFTMFFLLAIVATAAYALQGTLMVSYYRAMDQLSAVAYRGLSLGVTMLPLLCFVPQAEFSKVPEHALLIAAASSCAALANYFAAISYLYLSVGVACAAAMSFAAIAAAIIGYAFAGESLAAPQMIFAALILVSMLGLGITKSTGPLPPRHDARKGILCSVLVGILLGTAYALVGLLSRALHPFVVGYLWEFVIGVMAAAMAALRPAIGLGAGFSRLPPRDLLRLSLFSAPTAIGTGFYALSMTMGPIGIATAIISTMMVFMTVFAAVIYGEKPTPQQWMLLIAVCLTVAGLKLSSG